MAFKLLYPATAEKAAAFRANLSLCGAAKARVRVMPNGAARLVIASAADRDVARDALILSNACTASGDAFTLPTTRAAWNGPTEIFVRFLDA